MKYKVDFLVVGRYNGHVIKQDSLYVEAKDRAYAEDKVYKMLTDDKSPSKNEIILIDRRE